MYLALREMRHAKTRYALIITIMLLVSFLVLFVTGLARGLAYANGSVIENMEADYMILQDDADHRLMRSELSAHQLGAAEVVLGKERVSAFNLKMTTLSQENGQGKADVALIAIDPDSWIAPVVTQGKTLTGDIEGAIVVDRKLAKEGYTIGNVVVDHASGTSWTISGYTDDQSFSHTPVVFLNPLEWSKLQAKMALGRDARTDIGQYNAFAVLASEDEADQLRTIVEGVEVISKGEAVSAIPGYKEEQGSLMMMIVFLFVISAFVLAVFFYVVTIQKSGQFGVLKAIGTKTAYLVAGVVGQVLVLSVGSLTVSLLLIWAAEAVLPNSLPFQLESGTLAFVCGSFVAMSLAGSLLSVYQVAKTDALEAIGRTT